MARIITCLMLLLLWSRSGNAQDIENRWMFGARGGLNVWSTDLDHKVAGDSWSGILRYRVAPWFSLGLQIGYEELKAGSGLTADYIKLHSIPATFVGTFHLPRSATIAPYLFGGFGGLLYQRKDGLNSVVGKSLNTSIHIPVGAGIEWFSFCGLPNLAFVVEGSYALMNDRTDFVVNGSGDSYLSAKGGLNWYFLRESGSDPCNPDTDGDGLNDGDEEEKYKTDPLNPDTDSDGLNDGAEIAGATIELKVAGTPNSTKLCKTDPLNPDTDADGLKDGEEVNGVIVELRVVGKQVETELRRTDPLNPDTDGDNVSDGNEVMKYKTDPLNPDTDGDSLKDGEEVAGATVKLKVLGKPDSLKLCRTDPLSRDTDGDGLKDGEEIAGVTVELKVAGDFEVSNTIKLCKTDPLNPDTDGDDLSDGEEVDGATVELEVVGNPSTTKLCRTDPLNPDTDSDNLKDGQEVNGVTVDLKVVGKQDSTKLCRTDPLNPDTDGEGCYDGEEVTVGTDPLDQNSWLGCRDYIRGRLMCSVARFKSGGSDIPYTESLAQVLKSLKEDPAILVTVVGHADSRGSKRVNDALSVRRAEAVRDWLENNGVEQERMSIKGMGSSKPDKSYPPWHSEQRRVVIWQRF